MYAFAGENIHSYNAASSCRRLLPIIFHSASSFVCVYMACFVCVFHGTSRFRTAASLHFMDRLCG